LGAVGWLAGSLLECHMIFPLVPAEPCCSSEARLVCFECKSVFKSQKANKSFKVLTHAKETKDKGLLTPLAGTSWGRAAGKVNTS